MHQCTVAARARLESRTGCRVSSGRVLVAAPWMLHSPVGASKAADRRASTPRRAENQWENQDRTKNRKTKKLSDWSGNATRRNAASFLGSGKIFMHARTLLIMIVIVIITMFDKLLLVDDFAWVMQVMLDLVLKTGSCHLALFWWLTTQSSSTCSWCECVVCTHVCECVSVASCLKTARLIRVLHIGWLLKRCENMSLTQF